MRRLAIGIAAGVLSLIAAVLAAWCLQTHALGEALITDAKATVARSIERPALKFPAHENGYACVAAVEVSAPRDLSPFELEGRLILDGMLDAGVVPEPWRLKVESLEPWAEALRSCGNSTRLQFVEGVITPFKPPRQPTHVLALVHLTRLQIRLLGLKGRWAQAAELCAGSLEVILDRSNVNLYEAWLAGVAARDLAPLCGQALLHVGSDDRERIATRFALLRSRLVSGRDIIETQRQVTSFSDYGWLLTTEQLHRAPESVDLLNSPEELEDFLVALTWRRRDRAFRRFAAAADTPPAARQIATRAIEAEFATWWLPTGNGLGGRLEANEGTLALLDLLAYLAAGGTGPLPPQVTQTDGGLTFLESRSDPGVVLYPVFIPNE